MGSRTIWNSAASITACALLLIAGCGGQPAGSTAGPADSSTPATTTESRTSAKLPPLPDQDAPQTKQSRPASTTVRAVSSRYCGTVRAASGLTLHVKLGEGALACTEAERVVSAFHRAIKGKQPAGSDRPVAATVDGWDCVSGPPSSEGGTSCTKGGRNVLAAVVTEE